MAAPPILLVADDLSVIASVKRVLARESYECVLATSAADAVIAFGHMLPGLIILQPSVESDRGGVLLEELQGHPDAKLLRVVILGETIPGYSWPVVPLPLDPEYFRTVLEENIRTTDAAGSWSVLETAPPSGAPPVVDSPQEPDAWRATSPQEVDRDAPGDEEEMPEPRAIEPDPTPPEPPATPSAPGLEERLFGDLAADGAAPARQSVESSLPQPEDEELQHLEEEVRAEAKRRRQSREAHAVTVKPSPPPKEDTAPAQLAGEDSFEGMGERPAASPSRASEVLSRAEQMVIESRAQSQAHLRAEEADARALHEEAEAAARRAAHAESLVRAERDARGLSEEELYSLRDEVKKLNADFATERELARVRHENELEAFKAETDAAAEKLALQLKGEEKKRAEAETELAAVLEQLASAEDKVSESSEQLSTARSELQEQRALTAELETKKKTKLAALQTQLAESGAQAAAARVEAEEHEKLARALQAELEESAAQLTAARSQAGDRGALARELEDAGKERAELQAKLEAAAAQLATAHAEAAEHREIERQLQAAGTRLAALEAQLEEAVAQLAAAQVSAKERAGLAGELETANAKALGLEAKVSELEVIAAVAAEEQAKRQALEAVLAARDARIEALSQALHAAREDADAALALANEVDGERQRLAETKSQLVLVEQHLAEARQARDEAQSEMLVLEDARDRAQLQLTEANNRLEALQADVTTSSGLLEDTAKERDALRTRLATLEPYQPLSERLAADLETETRRRTGLEAQLDDASRSLDTTRTRAEAMEATAVLASEKVKALEAREVMSLALPGKHAVGVARHGSVDLQGLARVVCQLVLGNAEVRLELGTSGGTRTLWFKRGQIIAAESSLDHEGLIARARRDGLIDARQDAELRMLKGATPREQLDALKGRGFIRDIESVPLVQRYTEQVALDAFTEEQTLYRVVEEAPRADVLLATVPRPTLPMLAESLRRAVAPDVMLEQLGGGEAVPVATDSELDLRALGFSERERKMLTWVDGEATVEDLSLASGLKPDLSFRALLVAKLLGVIEVHPGVKKSEPGSGQLDLQRLEAKFDEVQDADYFTILGLSRAAGTEDVRRAFQRLAQEFDPLRFSGHPDPAIQQRAQVVAQLLEEAARALEDDRRRVEYARHLLD